MSSRMLFLGIRPVPIPNGGRIFSPQVSFRIEQVRKASNKMLVVRPWLVTWYDVINVSIAECK